MIFFSQVLVLYPVLSLLTLWSVVLTSASLTVTTKLAAMSPASRLAHSDSRRLPRAQFAGPVLRDQGWQRHCAVADAIVEDMRRPGLHIVDLKAGFIGEGCIKVTSEEFAHGETDRFHSRTRALVEHHGHPRGVSYPRRPP